MDKPQRTPRFDPADYPRTYLYKENFLEKAFALIVVMALAFVGTHALMNYSLKAPPSPDLLFFAIIIPPSILAAILLNREMVMVALTADTITVKRGIFKKSLERRDIKGWREGRGGFEDKDAIIIVPAHKSLRKLSLIKGNFKRLRVDEAFHAWYQSLPDLDKAAKDAYQQAIGTSATLGDGYEARQQRMKTLERFVRWLSYGVLAVALYFYITPNAYFIRLSPYAGLTILVFTILSGMLAFKYPILLREPVGTRKCGVDVLISVWGFMFFIWLGRDWILRHQGPDIFSLNFNYYYLTLIYALLSLPLAADRAWERLPRRLFSNAFFTLCGTLAFYSYGNTVLDHAAAPLVRHAYYAPHKFGAPDSKTPYLFKSREDAKIVMGCSYKYPGAFGTPWYRYGPCPLDFQKVLATK